MSNKHPITDHALLRWIERVHGVDIEAMRQEVLRACEPGLQSRAHAFPVGALWAVQEGGRIKSFLPNRPSALNHQKHLPAVNGTRLRGEPAPRQSRNRRRSHV